MRTRLFAGSRRMLAWSAGVAVLACSLGMTGCSSRGKPRSTTTTAGHPASTESSSSRAVARARELAGPDQRELPATRIELAEIGITHSYDAAVRQAVLAAARGRDAALFEEIIGRAARESRPIEPLLRESAAAAARWGGLSGGLAAVREVSGRECCLRLSFMSASLDGIADGFAAARMTPQVQAEGALRLDELAKHHDPDVAAAAKRAAAFFLLPPRTPGQAPH